MAIIEKILSTLTLGCKVNHYETEGMTELFLKNGYRLMDETDEYADVYLINTCTVTNLSDRKSRQMMRRAKRENPQGVLAVVGCYSQVSPEAVAQMDEVDIVLGTKDRNSIVRRCEEFLRTKQKIVDVGNSFDYLDYEDVSVEKGDDQTRGYVKIQDGCRQFCTYCIIPYARGPVRSRPLESIVKEVTLLGENGFKEVVLTGIHVGSYGKDLEGITLIDVIEEIGKIPAIERIRLSSVEPMTITREFLERSVKTKKLCDHFHLSLQNGSDGILKKMNRHYTTAEYEETVNRIREYYPHAGITTDVIVGFPGETDEDFQQTLDFVRRIGFSRLHVFKYSPREGTPAAKMNHQIHGEVKQRRSEELIALGEALGREFTEKESKRVHHVLFEEEKSGVYYGYTTNYIRVAITSSQVLTGKILSVKIRGGDEPVTAEEV